MENNNEVIETTGKVIEEAVIQQKSNKKIPWKKVGAVAGGILAVGGILLGASKLLKGNSSEDYDEDFDNDFEDEVSEETEETEE